MTNAHSARSCIAPRVGASDPDRLATSSNRGPAVGVPIQIHSRTLAHGGVPCSDYWLKRSSPQNPKRAARPAPVG